MQDKLSGRKRVPTLTHARNCKGALPILAASRQTKRALGNVRPIDKAPGSAVGLPGEFQPTLPALNGSESVIKSYILEDGKTGVVRLRLRSCVGGIGGSVLRICGGVADVRGLVRAGRL